MNPNDQIKHAAATEIDAGPGGTGLMGLVDEYRELKHISAQVGVMRAACFGIANSVERLLNSNADLQCELTGPDRQTENVKARLRAAIHEADVEVKTGGGE
jgi:hypothetical protein